MHEIIWRDGKKCSISWYNGDFTTAYILVKNSPNYTLKVGKFFLGDDYNSASWLKIKWEMKKSQSLIWEKNHKGQNKSELLANTMHIYMLINFKNEYAIKILNIKTDTRKHE